MAEALMVQDGEVVDWTADAAYSAGDVIQLRDGRAAVVSVDCASGDVVGVHVTGIFKVAKTTSMVVLIGSKLFWDHSANKAHLLHRFDRDFYLGMAQEDATSAGTTVKVALNTKPSYTVTLGDGFASIPIVTAGINHQIIGHGDGVSLIFDATNEAQKLDALSQRGFAPASIPIAEALVCINSNGSTSAVDFSVGLANGTHATDADSITESLFVHMDGGALDILLESDDGTTEVNATDSTVDAVAGTPFLVQWDLRDLSDIQVYIDGVNVLPSSVFKLNAATGPLKLLAHVEKTSAAATGNYSVMFLGARTAQA